MDPYKILGVSPRASQDEIKKAYRQLVKKYHPDKFAGTDLEEVAKEKLQEINEAYDALTSSKANQQTYRQSSSQSHGNAYNNSEFAQIRQLINLNNLAEAQSRLNNLSNRTAEWYYLSGVVYQRRGWYSEAIQNFRTAVSMEPNNREYVNALNQMGNRYTSYQGGRGAYGGMGNTMSGCDVCTSLICADCLCECCGGDLIGCC